MKIARLLLPVAIAFFPQGSEPFKGVTADGKVVPGLFRLAKTGVSTVPIKEAADAFLLSLTPEQKNATVYKVDDDEWRTWDNRTGMARGGVSLHDLSPEQRTMALRLIEKSLSAKGFKQSRDIMRLDETLRELTGRPNYGEWRYRVSILGTPSVTEPWGWQVDGHHLNVNYFVLGDQVVMTPAFMGAEPTTAQTGKYKGTTVLQEELNLGLKLMRSLTPEQQGIARIKSEKGPTENVAEAYRDNVVLAYAGLRADKMSPVQLAILRELMEEYVDNMPAGHAKVRMADVEAHLAKSHFAWIGGTSDDSVFYYRVHSPVILIEYDHQRPAALGGNGASRNHVHTVVRTPNGGDYGKDLLRQHHERHRH
ncbi:MAG: DUF3500 domain-containing protein [Fimbriimonas sp.]